MHDNVLFLQMAGNVSFCPIIGLDLQRSAFFRYVRCYRKVRLTPFELIMSNKVVIRKFY